ncbi:putative clathrin assembly protein [Camellia lanceoleosa]|uniref:Clathrin assembly protein n=1 Tax=Camellia lanceoleosa TaxID=1840588 RepID=A0ACC0GBR1_9ERIC|nr:putative clathrin assembly protein [Camellia lanceoleosa]
MKTLIKVVKLAYVVCGHTSKAFPDSSSERNDVQIILAIEYKKSLEVQEANLPSPSPPKPEPVKVEALVAGPLDLLGLNDPVPGASELDEKNALALAIVLLERTNGKVLSGAGKACGKKQSN